MLKGHHRRGSHGDVDAFLTPQTHFAAFDRFAQNMTANLGQDGNKTPLIGVHDGAHRCTAGQPLTTYAIQITGAPLPRNRGHDELRITSAMQLGQVLQNRFELTLNGRQIG